MTYTQHTEEYLVTKDGAAGDLHIPMSIITEAITHTADNDFDAHLIAAYIRNAMAVFEPANPEAAVVPAAEEIPSENAEVDRSLGLVIDGKMYSVHTDQFETLSDLAVWISETVKQARERAAAAYIAQLETDLEKAGFSQGDITVKIRK